MQDQDGTDLYSLGWASLVLRAYGEAKINNSLLLFVT